MRVVNPSVPHEVHLAVRAAQSLARRQAQSSEALPVSTATTQQPPSATEATASHAPRPDDAVTSKLDVLADLASRKDYQIEAAAAAHAAEETLRSSATDPGARFTPPKEEPLDREAENIPGKAQHSKNPGYWTENGEAAHAQTSHRNEPSALLPLPRANKRYHHKTAVTSKLGPEGIEIEHYDPSSRTQTVGFEIGRATIEYFEPQRGPADVAHNAKTEKKKRKIVSNEADPIVLDSDDDIEIKTEAPDIEVVPRSSAEVTARSPAKVTARSLAENVLRKRSLEKASDADASGSQDNVKSEDMKDEEERPGIKLLIRSRSVTGDNEVVPIVEYSRENRKARPRKASGPSRRKSKPFKLQNALKVKLGSTLRSRYVRNTSSAASDERRSTRLKNRFRNYAESADESVASEAEEAPDGDSEDTEQYSEPPDDDYMMDQDVDNDPDWNESEDKKDAGPAPAGEHVCKTCQKSFAQRHSLTRHMRRIHNQRISAERTVQCPTCFQYFMHMAALKSHMQVHRERETAAPASPASRNPKRVLPARRSSSSTVNELRPFECTQCGKSFEKEIQLQGHMRHHEETKKRPRFENWDQEADARAQHKIEATSSVTQNIPCIYPGCSDSFASKVSPLQSKLLCTKPFSHCLSWACNLLFELGRVCRVQAELRAHLEEHSRLAEQLMAQVGEDDV